MGKYSIPGSSKQHEPGIWLASEIWSNDRWAELNSPQQWAYIMMASQPDLSFCSVVQMDPQKWAGYCNGMTAERINDAITELARKVFVAPDYETNEIWVRQIINGERVVAPVRCGRRMAWNAVDQIVSERVRAFASHETELIYGPKRERKGRRTGSTRPFRVHVFERDVHALHDPGRVTARCFYCATKISLEWDGRNLKCGPNTEFDHIEPLTRGGADHVDNIVIACGTCNGSKNNKTVAEWLERVEAGRTAVKKSKRSAVISTLKGMV